MDRVRFGRALGFGARQAAKTLISAVDAATAESPSSRSGGVGAGTSSTRAQAKAELQAPAQPEVARGSQVQGMVQASRPSARVARSAAGAVEQARGVQEGVRLGSKRFKEAAWKPMVRLSGVLWLEVTGLFFGIFAAFALAAVWRLRGAWHETAANAESHRNLMGALAMLAVFGYFCVSSFMRARRRERQR